MTVKHIYTRRLYSCLHTKHKKHVPHTFRTHSRLEIVWDQTYMRLWWLGIKHIHVHCFLSPDTYAFVWFFVILHPNYAFVTKPYIPPEKSKINPGTHEMHIVVRRAHIVVCLLSLGCLRPQATKYPTMSSIFLIWRSVERSVSHSVCRNQYGKRCAAAACAWAPKAVIM